MINKDDFFAKETYDLIEFEVEELKDTIYLKQWSEAIKKKLSKDIKKYDDITGEILMFVYSVCDDRGNIIFAETDIPNLEKMNGMIFKKVADKVLKINGLSEEEQETDEKNS